MSEENEEVPVFDLTLLENSEGQYAEAVKELCESLSKAQNNVLDTYWSVGELIHNFVNDQIDEDGSRNVSKILSVLSDAVLAVSGGHLDYSDSTLRKMLTFREAISSNQLKRLKSLGVPVSKALPMCIGDVSHEERDEIIEEIESGANGSAQIPEMVRELHPTEERDETRGGAGPFQTVKKLNSTLDKLCNLVEDDLTLHTATVMGSDDEGPQVDYLNQLRISKNKLGTLQRVHKVICSVYLVGDHSDEED